MPKAHTVAAMYSRAFPTVPEEAHDGGSTETPVVVTAKLTAVRQQFPKYWQKAAQAAYAQAIWGTESGRTDKELWKAVLDTHADVAKELMAQDELDGYWTFTLLLADGPPPHLGALREWEGRERVFAVTLPPN